MTREEAIKMLKSKMDGTVDTSYEWAETVRMAIEALHKTEAQIEVDEWCTDCKEYNHERHCCPRWNKVIRETLKDMQMEKRTKERIETHACDLISRKAAIDAVNGVIADYIPTLYGRYEALPLEMAKAIKRLPTIEPTLYGYNIKHLAFVATVMEKEGVTAEYAARTFGDMSRASRMLIEELQEKVEKSLSAMQLPSAQPEIIRCKECLMHGVCRFEQGLGLDGYCSQAERRTDENNNE